MKPPGWPYSLPIWRRFHEAVSPDGKLVARIDPAYEVSMSNPTSGILCVSNGLHIAQCNPSFIWSDDSAYLAVPRYFQKFGIFRRQKLLVVSFADKRVYASNSSAWYFQPEEFVSGWLAVSENPSGGNRKIEFQIPEQLNTLFTHDPWIAWPEMPRDCS